MASFVIQILKGTRSTDHENHNPHHVVGSPASCLLGSSVERTKRFEANKNYLYADDGAVFVKRRGDDERECCATR